MTRIQFSSDGEEGDNKVGHPVEPQTSNISKPGAKRMRWATTRRQGESGIKKRMSILNRVPKVRLSTYAEKPDEENNKTSISEESPMGQQQQGHADESRKIYFNQSLPPSELNEDGQKLKHFPRNKIRTAKYTPLSFVPKNLWFQFHNVANVYFLFIIILGIFSIFGNDQPALSSVPLIVILTLTALKDGIEDWRRTVLDSELNNAPVYRLVEWDNVNSSADSISLWRRIKKASTKGVVSTYRFFKKIASNKKSSQTATDGVDLGGDRRMSTATRPTIRTSVYSERLSFQSEQREDVEMTPVPSPGVHRSQQATSGPGNIQSALAPEIAAEHPTYLSPEPRKAGGRHSRQSLQGKSLHPSKDWGTILNTNKATDEKAKFKKDYWKNVQVGDFVRIYNDDQIPADVVVLSTSDPDGACYVETKNLDGETNLKVRHALQAGRSVRHARDCERAEFVIESEGPHPNLYAYSAIMRWQETDHANSSVPTRDMAEPIGINNLLLRGCSLRNTEWILGVVVFTGQETKIMMNAGITPSKRARLAKDLNWNVMYNFIILFLMCLVSGIVQGVTWSRGGNTAAYFEFGTVAGSPPLNGFVTFWAAVILFQNLIPISLYISLELVRLAQAFFIYSDTYMYYDKIDYPCTPKSWNISDDIGQIEYIFSDKTGTLTQNVMEFRKCTVNGIAYGEAYTEAEAGMRRRQGIDVEEEGARIRAQIAEDRIQMLKDIRATYDNPYLRDENLTFVAPTYINDLNGASGTDQRDATQHFMLALALCHTVITETTPGDPPTIDFKAQSPDEAALVATARDCGFTVLGRTNDDLHLNALGNDRTYRVLNTLEFNSTRKRMSAIVRMPDGRIKLFCKGADSMIYSRLARGKQQELRKETAQHLELFAREGLRTLCVAERDLTEEEYDEWSKDYDFAAQAIENREDRLEEVSDRIERELMLLGGTAIEDRLQDGVPDTISLLAAAGIKLWVLTGDKVETAINIGFSCNLLSNEMELILFDIPEGTIADAGKLLDENLAKFGMSGSDEELAAARKHHEPPPPTHALVIDGESLKLVLHEELRQRFLLLCKQCKSVLCCRVSPAQKAAVVQLVRTGLDIMALSIGDGANDVAMIQEADVGVGIAGEEGRQAVMSSDYAIGQFRFLQRLVLVHGRWSYRRLAECIANFFYKNIVWTFALFWYQIYNNFDITYLFDYTYILLVNLAFTSLVVIFMGVFDQDVSDKVSLAVPQLYRSGIERTEWTQTKFWLYMGDGVYQSAICFFMGYLLFAPATFVTENGRDLGDRGRMGVYIACAAIVVINTYIMLNTYRWDWLTGLIYAFSILLVFFWTGVYSSFEGSFQFYHAGSEVLGNLTFWALLPIIVLVSLLPRFCVKFLQKNFRPYNVDVIREQVQKGDFDHLDNYEAFVPPKATESSATSSDITERPQAAPASGAFGHVRETSMTESQRPIYPPSEAPTARTRPPHSQTGSDGTDRTRASLDVLRSTPLRRPSLERIRSSFEGTGQGRLSRPSIERVRSSFERSRTSFERMRPSFEGSRDFTSAALLARMESSQSHNTPVTPTASNRRLDITSELR